MHRRLTRILRTQQHRNERGAVAIIVAVSMTLLLVAAGMVLDFGLVRVDRQIDKSAADSATLAGLHALNTGDGNPHPYVGVCTAVRYLKANSGRFSGVSESSGWKNGLGASTGNGCSSTALRNKTCSPTDKATWAKWAWTGTSGGLSLDVTIESGYSFTGSTWPEDSLPASTPDTGVSTQQGCDQLAVSVTQSRKPGLGSLATSSDLVTRIRSVGRIKPVPGDSAPAMLLLKQTGCSVLTTGNAGGGSGTSIHVFGAKSSDGRSQPGTIHADSDGLGGCTGGGQSRVYLGYQAGGIVAYAAPLVTNPTSPDPAKPGSITSVASANGLAANIVRDSPDYVYGSSALNGTAGTKTEVTGRTLVTRKLVDERYFLGVNTAITGASSLFSAGPTGWIKLSDHVPNPCKPTQAQLSMIPRLNATSMLNIDCTANPGFIGNGDLSIPAAAVYFQGWLNPASKLGLPNADRVYINNQGNKPDALLMNSAGSGFEVNNQPSNLDPGGKCSTGPDASKSVLFVRTGAIKEATGASLQMCRTTVFMMGGHSQGCVPVLPGTSPTITPCAGTLGTGQLTQQGGNIDWTAPDTMDATTDPVTGDPLLAAVTAWSEPTGPEDLALWSESSSNTSTKFSMAGTGAFRVRGVFMVPNAVPFAIKGGSGMDLTNAQFIVTSIELDGGAAINMSVDPNSAVTLPDIDLVGLVR